MKHFFSAAISLFFVLPANVPASDQSLRTKFIEEINRIKEIAPPRTLRIISHSSQNMSDRAANLMYSKEYLSKKKKAGNDVSRQNTYKEFVFHDGNVMKKERHKNGERIVAKNKKYAFAISKNAQSDNYIIEYAEKRNNSSEIDDMIEKEEKRLRQIFKLAWTFNGSHLADWLQKENFNIIGVKQIDYAGKELVRLDYEHVVKEITLGNYCLTDAYVICDPDFQWAVREASAVFNNAAGEKVTKQTTLRDFLVLDNGFPLVNKNTCTTEFIGRDDSKIVNQYEYEISSDVSEDEFYLSYYGLPEPNFEEPFLSAWMKYLLAGLFCLAVAYWIKRRRASV